MEYRAYGYRAGKKTLIASFDSMHRRTLKDAVSTGAMMDLDAYGYRVITLECDGQEVDESAPGHGCSHESPDA